MTGFLIFMILVLMGSIFYISRVLLADNPSSTGRSAVAPLKTKAAGKTYSKLLAINQTVEPTQSDIMQSLPTDGAPTQTAVVTGQQTATTISPTETVLAYQSLSPTSVSGTSSPIISSTISPTVAQTLPETGYFNNTIILFAVSSLFLFVAFLF